MRAQPLSKMALARWSALRCSARMVLLVRSRAGKTKPSHGDVVGVSDSEGNRHNDVAQTHQFYTYALSRHRMVATGKMLSAILSHAPDKKRTDSGLDRKTVQKVLQG